MHAFADDRPAPYELVAQRHGADDHGPEYAGHVANRTSHTDGSPWYCGERYIADPSLAAVARQREQERQQRDAKRRREYEERMGRRAVGLA